MPRPRKIVINKTTLFVSTSVEEGLLLTADRLTEAILWSVLGRAQYLHPVRISHILVESTHIHMLLVVDNPEDVRGFMERFKTESAHAINRMLGRKKRTVWCEGYDSPVVLTSSKVMKQIVYLYTNPAKDNLERSIERYPGVSSWRMYRTGRHSRRCPWIRRKAIPDLRETREGKSELAARLCCEAIESHEFNLHPDAWMECFDIEEKEREGINQLIFEEINEQERELEKQRRREGRTVIGRKRLRSSEMDPSYQPVREGRRMLCLSDNRDLRMRFIARIKRLARDAREILLRWRNGDIVARYPPGLYPPSIPRLIEPLGIAQFG